MFFTAVLKPMYVFKQGNNSSQKPHYAVGYFCKITFITRMLPRNLTL